MIGAIIGDIAGSRFEFRNHKSKEFELFADGCRATDDSVMTLAVARAMMETDKARQHKAGDFSRDGEYEALLEQTAVKAMREIGRSHPDCGYGASFRKWIFSGDPRPYNSFGNGAAVRIGPAGFAARTEDEARELSEAVTKATHNHPEGIKGAETVAVAVFMARRGFLKEEIRRKINDDYYPLDFTIDGIRAAYEFDETCRGTVPQAIEAFLESVSFEDAVRLAVSVGGDSDTLAAITGSIADAYYGVPEELERKALSYLDDDLRAICGEWKAFTAGGENAEKFRVLTKYIGKIDFAVSADDRVGEGENGGAPGLPARFPFIAFRDLVRSFEDEFLRFSESRPELRLADYQAILKSNGLKWDGGVMRRADAGALDAGCVLALIMGAVRADRLCRGALSGFLKDGSMLKWLKRLKDIDRSERDDAPEEIRFVIGGFFGGYTDFRIVFDTDGASKTVTAFQGKSEKTLCSSEEAALLKKRFAGLHTEYWDCDYADERICDGEQWELAVRYPERPGVVWGGNNAYPPNWAQVLDLFGLSHEDENRPEIEKLTLEFFQTVRPDGGGAETGAVLSRSESLTADREKGQIALRQTAGNGRSVTHRYDAPGWTEEILRAAGECLQAGGWVETKREQDGTGVRFYRLKAEYRDGAAVCHAGVYDRANLPEEPWLKLMDTVWGLIGSYGFGELMDKKAFLNAGKAGEIKYCSVAFEEYGRTFYYRTDDDTIGIGDAVIVPFGAANTEREGVVEEIGFYRADKAPFPLEKTKQILRKAEKPE